MATKAIKGVDEDAWNVIKSSAADKGVGIGEFFNELAHELKGKSAKSQWERILASRVKHTKKEWEEIERDVKYFRENFRMRAFK